MKPSAATTELRKDPVSTRWVLLRYNYPPSYGHRACPFCPGAEAETSPEITAYRHEGYGGNGAGWLVRVIPERAPLFQIEGNINREGAGMFDRVTGRGASEIVIEHPDHNASWDTMPARDLERILWMYRDRTIDLYRDRQIRAVLVLRRERTPSNPVTHPFSRVIGSPVIFDDLRYELSSARQHFQYKNRCLFCDIVRQERQDGVRVIEESKHFLVYSPYGSSRPYETWIVPLGHRHRYQDVSTDQITDLARTLQQTFRRLHTVQPGTPLELALHSSPNESMRIRDDDWQSLAEDFHWHIEIFPRISVSDRIGGFAVNPMQPEAAAKAIREGG